MASCAVAALAPSACDFDEAEQSAAPAEIIRACTTAGQTWWNDPLGQPFTQLFYVELDATPSASPTDAVIGLAANQASGFAQLATIVRFNTAGAIDVRDGGVYRADRAVTYQAGVKYRVRLEVDVTQHRYSVDLRRADGVTWDRIARNYAFRTEQAGVSSLGWIATKLDGAGTLGLCYDAPVYMAGPCEPVSAGAGFVNAGVPSASNVIVAEVTATPSTTSLDGVHGLSLGPTDAFSDLAAAFRFTPSGTIDARDGDTYRADTALGYTKDTPHRVRIIADLASHTYSVQVARTYEAFEIARSHRFRTQQAGVASLDNYASIVDSPTGTVRVCDRQIQVPAVIFRRSGTHSVAADAKVISDGITTQRIGDRGEPLATFARGGEVAVDAAGNVYIARITGSTLAVDSLTPAFALRWSRAYPAGGTQVTAIGVTDAGDITIVMGSALRQISPAGVSRWTRPIGEGARAIPTRAGYAVAYSTGGSVTVEQLDRDASSMWTRSWPNHVDVHQLATNPLGQIIFGGEFYGTINFGGASFEAHPGSENGPMNTFVVALSPAGEHVFSQRISEQNVTAIASNGVTTVVAAHHYIGPISTTLYTLDQSGTVIGWREGLAGFGWFGRTYRLAMSMAGRVYWSYGPSWPDNFTEWPQLVAY